MTHHGGDPAKHLPLESLDAALENRPPAPRDEGRVVALVTRQPEEGRSEHERLAFSREGGAEGDRWTPGKKGTDNQVTMMEAGIGALIANGQSLALFGDNLIVELALDAANLPAGSQLEIGGARFEVTPEPHTGCAKYKARFGGAALRAISRKDRRDQRLRGIHVRVLEEGEVAIGDPVRVILRG